MRLSPGAAAAAAPCSLLGVVPCFSKCHAKNIRVKHTEYIVQEQVLIGPITA